MDIQRLRNLTTGRLHTDITHVYQDIELLTGAPGLMTHQIPNAMRALEPYLQEHIQDSRFWDGKYDVTHIGEIEVPVMDKDAANAMFDRYEAMPSSLGLIGSGHKVEV